MFGETPSGAINGSNVTFTVTFAPSPVTSLFLFRNGVLQLDTTDYSVSGSTITFVTAPLTGDWLRAGQRDDVASMVIETPTGAINGSNVTFTLSQVPSALQIYRSGVLQLETTDYTISSKTITFATAPLSNDWLRAYYALTVPVVVDPPFPPVWPYPTGSVYQREHWDMTHRMNKRDVYQFDFSAVQDGVAVDLTGGTVRFTAKWRLSDTDANAVIRLDSAGLGGISITNAAGGLGRVTVPSASTSSLPNYTVELFYDLQFTSAASQPFTIMKGSLVINPDVTITQ